MRHSLRSIPQCVSFAPARALFCALILTLALLASSSASAQASAPLPRSIPEKEGVSSRALLSFVEAMDKSGMEFHSVMVLRHGKVVAEGWWNPYAPDLKHTMYSCSKSFTSTAVGFAVTEGRLSVDDKVISFFPEDLPDTVSSNLAALRVRDLLSMSAGQVPDPTNKARSTETNWVKAFLATPIVDKPGTKFLYNTLATYMLSAIVQKVTGQKLIDYLRPRLFEPLGIEGMDWEVDPRGINTGGWGLRIRTEDMARFGLMYLQDGVWEGKQIIPKEWVREATTMKILQSPDMPQSKRDSSDWQQGYCYQFWRCRHNAFRGDGAFGQLIVMLPEQDAVLVVTAETTDMQAELNLVWQHLLPAFHAGELPADEEKNAELGAKLASLSIPPPAAPGTMNGTERINGKSFAFDMKSGGVHSLKFDFANDLCRVTAATVGGEFLLSFGRNAWAAGTTLKPGPDLIKAKGNFDGLPPFRTRGSYRWKDDRTLELTLRYIESPHTETYTCTFDGDKVSITGINSLDRGKTAMTLNGSAESRKGTE